MIEANEWKNFEQTKKKTIRNVNGSSNATKLNGNENKSRYFVFECCVNNWRESAGRTRERERMKIKILWWVTLEV